MGNMRLGQRKCNLPTNQARRSIGLDLSEAYTNSFIVRIWVEETAEEAGQATWRGRITHVPSGEQCYVKDLSDIVAVIASYLEGMGVKLGIGWRMKQWLRRWKLCLARHN